MNEQIKINSRDWIFGLQATATRENLAAVLSLSWSDRSLLTMCAQTHLKCVSTESRNRVCKCLKSSFNVWKRRRQRRQQRTFTYCFPALAEMNRIISAKLSPEDSGRSSSTG